MNQLFNPLNYSEFQAFEALPRWKPPGVYRRKPDSHPVPPSYFFLLPFPIVPGNKKAAEAFLHPAAFRLIVFSYANPRESSVGWSITAVVVSPWSA